LTFPHALGRAGAALLFLAALAGCEVFKRNEEAMAIVNARVIGMPVGEFIDRYGRPERRSELPDGTLELLWTAAVDPRQRGWQDDDEHICKLRLSTDKRLRISSVQILYDAQGKKSISRCGEVFTPG
jgi:hypothetical protein